MSRSTRGRSRSAIATVTLAAVLCALAGAGADGTADAADPLRIMPLGDSITEGHQIPGGYRIDLEDDLLAAGIAFDFVGSLQNGPAALADKEHEGHSGWRIDQLHASVGGWLTTHQPDLVLLLIGTNDVRQDYQLSTAPSRLAALVDRIHTTRPATRILLSSIPPFADATDNTQAAAYNAAIPEIVDTRAAQGRPISFVDAGRRLTLDQLADGVHPNASGYSSLADSWLAAIRATAGGNAPPTVALTAPPDGASYAAGTAVALQASASDGDGQVTRVEFFAGQTKLGEDQSDPYQLSWASPPAGSHQLSARATDNQGATTTSTTRTIMIAGTGERTLYRAINLGGPALTIDGRPWESGTSANVSAGPTVYENQSIALEPPTDSERARMIRSVVWGSSLTTVRLSAVPTGTYEVYLTVWEDNNSSTIDIRLDGVLVRAGYPTGSGGHWERLGPWPLGVSDGTLDLTAGPDANLSGIEVWHVASGGPGNAPPTVALTAPPDGASYAAGTAVALQASASDGDGQVTRVEFFAGQTKLAEDQSDPYQLSWASPPAGSHQLSARATDNQGATTTSATRTITVAAANTAPTAVAKSASTRAGTAVEMLLEGSDSETCELTFEVTGPPSHGTLGPLVALPCSTGTPHRDGGRVTYTPTPGYVGQDAFTYRVLDGNLASAPVSVGITVEPAPSPSTISVADLDGAQTNRGKTWSASVTVSVVDGTGTPLSGVEIAGSWSSGAGASCTTGTNGSCVVTLAEIAKRTASVRLGVSRLTRSSYTYDATLNRDPDGDSDGTTITVAKP